ncbi:MAG TPA: hypothetical protein VE309_03150 [Caulobacteraceae bacterium]|nr:hypothetical protein [Caulobacteraceae bacterium]
MTEPATSSAMPTYADTILSTLLMGAAAPLVSHGTMTGAQEQQIIGGILAALSVAWQVMNANPHNQSPIALILGLVARSGRGAAWNAGVGLAEGALADKAAAYARAEVRAVAGPVIGGIAAPLAAKAAEEAIEAASKTFLYPQP